MTKDELIAKQQMEIEHLKIQLRDTQNACSLAHGYMISVQQWSITADEFPKIAMNAAVRAEKILSGVMGIEP